MSYLALAAVAGLAAIERKGFLQAMLSRPVALGAIVGAVLGDPGTGLLVGIPLELLWLGAVNMGAALPVHEALGAAASAGGAVLCLRGLPGGAEPARVAAVAALVVAVCLPLAWIGRRVDGWVEQWNDHLYERAEHELARGETVVAVRANLYGIALPFAVAAVLAPVAAMVSATIAREALVAIPGLVGPLAAGWLAFCGVACASGARSMRSRKAPAGFAAGLGAALVAMVAWLAMGGAR